jgi:hypothetical protein
MPNDTCRCCVDFFLGHLALGRRGFVSGATAASMLAAVALPSGSAPG